MLKKSKRNPTIFEDRRKESGKLDNLSTSCFLSKSKCSARKEKSKHSKSSTDTSREGTDSNKLFKQSPTATNVPRDAAVHFGKFYHAQGASTKKLSTKRFADNITSLKLSPRSDFTRQMVHKLERTAGTEEYARQVSALLEETVEPAHFKLNPLPSEESIPHGKHNPSGYPLWYKEPYKMPLTSDEIYKFLKERYTNDSKSREIFEEFSEDESEESSEDEETKTTNKKSVINKSSSGSTFSAETKVSKESEN